MLSRADLVVGSLVALITLGACLAAAWTVVSRRAAFLGGVERLLAVGVVASAALVAVHLLPGAAGLLSRWTVLAAAVAVWALASKVGRREYSEDLASAPAAPEPTRVGRAVAVAVAAVAAVAALALVLDRSLERLQAIDALTTHLPTVVRWIQEGSLWQLVQYAPDLSNGTYPHNGTLIQLAAVLPWESTFGVRFVNLPFLAMAAVAVFAAARQIGAPLESSALAATAVTAMAAVNEPALEQAQVDAPMLAWFAAGCLFLIRWVRGGQRSDLVIAGLGLGLAFGTKWYAVVYVPMVVLLGIVARGGGLRSLVSPAAALTALVAASGGFWLVRNWVETGNPVHPVPVAAGGVTVFSAPPDPLRDFAGFTVSDYLFDATVWREWLAPAYWDNFGLLGPLLLAVVLVALVSGRARTRATAVAAVAMAAAYTVLPDTAFGPPGEPVLAGANARYLVPAMLAAAVTAAGLARGNPVRRATINGALVLGSLDGVWRSYGDVAFENVVRGALVAAGLATAVVISRRIASSGRSGHVALAVAAVGVWIGLVSEAHDRFTLDRYGENDAALSWVEANVPDDASVALAGTWSVGGISPVLPAFGDSLERRVDYLGRFVDGTLRRWENGTPFIRQLREARYHAVIVGTGASASARAAEPELGWARAAGYRVVARSDRLIALAR